MTDFSGVPNLLLIISDQHHPDVIGARGDDVVETPNLDRLAARGAIFTNAYCPSPLCAPSRMAMMTGLEPRQIEVWTNEHIVTSGVATLPRSMGARGLRPHLVGKLHARGADQLMGFIDKEVGDHGPSWFGGPGAEHGPLRRTSGPFRVSLDKSGSGAGAYQIRDEQACAAAVHRIEEWAVHKRAGHTVPPLNLTVGWMLPHQPYIARSEDCDRYADRVPRPRNYELLTSAIHPHYRWWRRECGIEEVDGATVDRTRAAYWAMVHRLDVITGTVLDALERTGELDNTLIVYTSDHGEMIGEHGLWWKQSMYEASIRVPMIMSWPKRIPEGAVVDHVVTQYDLTASILKAVDAPELPRSSGRDLFQLFDPEGAGDWEDLALAEYCTSTGQIQRMVRLGRWKLVYFHGFEPQLFDLEDDPDELRDLAADPAYSAIRSELMSEVLTDWDPELIRDRITVLDRDLEIIAEWTRRTNPADDWRIHFDPSWSRLDDEAVETGPG